MGKTKNKNRSEVEHLRGEVRRLKRQLKQLQKLEHLVDEAILSEPPPEEEVIKIKHCVNCGKGKITIFELLGRFYEQCDLCDYRKKLNG